MPTLNDIKYRAIIKALEITKERTLNELEYEFFKYILENGIGGGFSGDYNDLTNKPDLKQGAFHDVGNTNDNDLITKATLMEFVDGLNLALADLSGKYQELDGRVAALEAANHTP